MCVYVECVFTNNPEHIAPQWNGLKTSLPDCRDKLEPSQIFATKCQFFWPDLENMCTHLLKIFIVSMYLCGFVNNNDVDCLGQKYGDEY